MSDMLYMISEASRKVHVETHVLRYWEEELAIDIPRNELGHRYYTEEHIRLFQIIKILKEKGYQLKAIRELMPHLYTMRVEDVEQFQQRGFHVVYDMDEEQEKNACGTEGSDGRVETALRAEEPDGQGGEEKLRQFENLMTEIVHRALEQYDMQRRSGAEEEIPVILSDSTVEQIVSGIDGLLAKREEREEERYRMLDEAIRNYQRASQETAASLNRGWGLFRRGKKQR